MNSSISVKFGNILDGINIITNLFLSGSDAELIESLGNSFDVVRQMEGNIIEIQRSYNENEAKIQTLDFLGAAGSNSEAHMDIYAPENANQILMTRVHESEKNNTLLVRRLEIAEEENRNRNLEFQRISEIQMNTLYELQSTKRELEQTYAADPTTIQSDNQTIIDLGERVSILQKKLNSYDALAVSLKYELAQKDTTIQNLTTQFQNDEINFKERLDILREEKKKSKDDLIKMTGIIENLNEQIGIITGGIEMQNYNLANEKSRKEYYESKDNESLGDTFQDFDRSFPSDSSVENVKMIIIQLLNIKDENFVLNLKRFLYLFYKMTKYFNMRDIIDFMAMNADVIYTNVRFIPNSVNNIIRDLKQIPPYDQKYNMYNYIESAYTGVGDIHSYGLKSNNSVMASQRKASILIYNEDTLEKLDKAVQLKL